MNNESVHYLNNHAVQKAMKMSIYNLLSLFCRTLQPTVGAARITDQKTSSHQSQFK